MDCWLYAIGDITRKRKSVISSCATVVKFAPNKINSIFGINILTINYSENNQAFSMPVQNGDNESHYCLHQYM